MVTGRTLKIAFSGAIDAQYRKTDKAINPDKIKGDIRYVDAKKLLTNGTGTGNVDLLHYSRRTLNNSVLTLDLDTDLTNVWGDVLDFNAVKVLLIHNRETLLGRDLDVTFKDEAYSIGPDGTRILIEPQGAGVRAAEESSSSVDEGDLVFTTVNSVTFDLIIGGATLEASSSGA